MGELVEIKLTYGMSEFKTRVRREDLSAIISAVSSYEAVDSDQQPSEFVKPAISRPVPDTDRLQMYLAEYRPGRHMDTILTVVFFLKKESGLERVSKEEIERVYEKYKLSKPRNLSRELNWAVSAQCLEKVGGYTDLYYLTNKGEAAVLSGFPSTYKKATRVREVLKPSKQSSSLKVFPGGSVNGSS